MKSIKNYNSIPTLLSKALLGTLSEQEEEQLKTWRENCQETDRLYKSMMSAEYIEKRGSSPSEYCGGVFESTQETET